VNSGSADKNSVVLLFHTTASGENPVGVRKIYLSSFNCQVGGGGGKQWGRKGGALAKTLEVGWP